ncbi:hypothetical protein JHK86_014742 [Glycine max]|nr:hypothetical protein JHK86_014742 [Glycine max]
MPSHHTCYVMEIADYGVDNYDIGSDFGHFGVAEGRLITREPGPVKDGSAVIALIEDPDGYKFKLLERRPTSEPLCQLMLRVGDIDRVIAFYEK